jgi:hypothetical protein
MDDYLSKPYTIAGLGEKINLWLGPAESARPGPATGAAERRAA